MAREDPMARRNLALNAQAAADRPRLPADPEIRAPLVGTKLQAPASPSWPPRASAAQCTARPRARGPLPLDAALRSAGLRQDGRGRRLARVAGARPRLALARRRRQRSRPLRPLPCRGAASGPARGGRRDSRAVRPRCKPQHRSRSGPRSSTRSRRATTRSCSSSTTTSVIGAEPDPPPGPVPDRARTALRPPRPPDPGGPAPAPRPPAGPRSARRAAGRRPALHGRGGVGLSRRGAACRTRSRASSPGSSSEPRAGSPASSWRRSRCATGPTRQR